jgi:hypothetical protein
MALLKRILRALPLLLISPFLVAIGAAVLAISDIFSTRRRRDSENAEERFSALPRVSGWSLPSASAVIPNWNGRDLLEKYLPSVIAAFAGHPRTK